MTDTKYLPDDEVEAFLAADYAGRDTMHDLTHVRRVRKAAERLAAEAAVAYDSDVLRLGAYLHGVVHGQAREAAARGFLLHRGVPPGTVDLAVRAARESHVDARPETPEGTLLHDGHLLEGDRSFMLVKSLVTGAARGGSLAEIAAFCRRDVAGRHRCVLAQAQARYAEQEEFASAVFDELAPRLEPARADPTTLTGEHHAPADALAALPTAGVMPRPQRLGDKVLDCPFCQMADRPAAHELWRDEAFFLVLDKESLAFGR